MSQSVHQSDPFVEAVARFIDERALIPPGASVVTGVSGGPDSVALLAVLRELGGRAGRSYGLTVAHLNHGLRPGAEADARFVADLAQQWSLPCVSERRDVAAVARSTGRSTETAARAARYDFLQSAAQSAGAGFVAVGHHADDNIETIMYRIVRGTHIHGLAGIPASRRLGHSPIMLIRPLLGQSRSEIEAFCRRRRLDWRTDPTNVDSNFRRNFIRHELMPLLRRRLNRRADEALLRLGSAAGEIDALLRKLARAALTQAAAKGPKDSAGIVLDLAALSARERPVRTYALRLALESLGVPLRDVGTEAMDRLDELVESGLGGSVVSLPGRFRARRQGGQLIIEPLHRGDRPEAAAVTLACPGTTPLPDGREVACRFEPFDLAAFEAHRRAGRQTAELLDADQIHLPLVCRSRRQGDVFLPLGSPGRQKVGRFLTNLKLPPQRRDEVRCICDELGIVYVAPLRIDERVKVTDQTRRALRIEITAG